MTYKVALTSLGCSKNLVDSEIMLGILKERNFEITGDVALADAIIVNTCGFILSAKEESIETILSLAKYKEKGKCRILIATGCLVEKYRAELTREIPEVDAFLGTGDFTDIAKVMEKKLPGTAGKGDILQGDMYRYRFLTTPGHYTYVKIAEGCSNRCTYCLIPQMRGDYCSRPMDSIINEVQNLAGQGVKEINLIAQDTTFYGVDLYGESKLAELLKHLSGKNMPWLRLFYCYPEKITRKLLEVMAGENNICKYLDIPIQHADDYILKRMGRKETRKLLSALFKEVREIIPDAVLRTTCMVGFPGETEEMFDNLLSFLEEVRFDWLGTFTYSPEDDTPAALMTGQIPEEIKQDRYDRVMSLQSKISQKNNRKWIGKTFSVLVEGKSSDNPEYFIGRSQYQAPDVDGVVIIKANDLKIGDIVTVNVLDSDIYDLIGEIKTK